MNENQSSEERDCSQATSLVSINRELDIGPYRLLFLSRKHKSLKIACV